MAKTNPNDRNAKFLAKRKAEKGYFISDNGRKFKLKEKPNVTLIQQAINSVEFPDKPTYSVRVGNRVQEYPLDMDVIRQTEDLDERRELTKKWSRYINDLSWAQQEQAKRGTATTIYEGTEVNADMMDKDEQWQKDMKRRQWKLPADVEERWILYCQTTLSDDELGALGTKVVMQLGGVSEEEIDAAMDMFRDDLPARPQEPGDVVNPETDQGDSTGG